MRILFMGTPEIAELCLAELINDGKDIVAVVTREDKPRGRGKVMTPTPVKSLALSRGIDVYTPATLKGEEFAGLLEKIDPQLIVVVAYGKILPKSVLDYPRFGCINLHVSLLPKYRGAAPMQRAIINGESTTGVTVMYMNEGLDTGDIIAQESFPIGNEDDFETVHDTSARIGAPLLSKTIDSIFKGEAHRISQNSALATYAEKIEKTDCKIDFTKSAQIIDRAIRGVTPIPGAFALLGGKMIKIFKARPDNGRGIPGEVIAVDGVGEGSFLVACGDGALRVFGVIPEGKGRMSAGDFVRGRKISVGDRLE